MTPSGFRFHVPALTFTMRGGCCPKKRAGHTPPSHLTGGGELGEPRQNALAALARFLVNLEAEGFGEGRGIDDIDIRAARRPQARRRGSERVIGVVVRVVESSRNNLIFRLSNAFRGICERNARASRPARCCGLTAARVFASILGSSRHADLTTQRAARMLRHFDADPFLVSAVMHRGAA